MTLPVHRWFRYSAGFSAEWVAEVLSQWGMSESSVVLDPFAGSGTVALVGDSLGLRSIGVEAHYFVARICRAKLLWWTSVGAFRRLAEAVLEHQFARDESASSVPSLMRRSFDEEALHVLRTLKAAWRQHDDGSPESELVWLAITAILRPSSCAGTAQWQYIQPVKRKKHVVPPALALRRQVELMASDMLHVQRNAPRTRAEMVLGDARDLARLVHAGVDAVITSPPYANNFDYGDALRFEMTFWDEVDGWGGIHDKVRRDLIVSSSQHASREKLKLEALLKDDAVTPIRRELAEKTTALAEERLHHGGKKHYHTMVAAYCKDIATVLQQLRIVCKAGSRMCWVIGDSAPYGVHCPIERWIGELALAAGFRAWRFEKLRDRNVKWKNRKHRVPLTEGFLWIDG